jgi:hypothetical protein
LNRSTQASEREPVRDPSDRRPSKSFVVLSVTLGTGNWGGGAFEFGEDFLVLGDLSRIKYEDTIKQIAMRISTDPNPHIPP